MVVCIKKTYIKIMIMFLVLVILTSVSVSAKNQAELKFVEEPTYTLIQEVTKGEKIIGWVYQIDVKIQNVGDITSKETIVNLSDEEGFILQNITTFSPGETKTISFTWSTISSYDQTIRVKYFPLDLSVNNDQYNSGSTSFKILVGGKDEVPAASTPGFEVIVFITAIAVVLFLINKKKK